MVFVNLYLAGEVNNPHEIAKKLGRESFRYYPKGERLRDGTLREKDLLYFGVECETNEVEERICTFLDDLASRKEVLDELSKQCQTSLWVSAYPDEIQFGFTLPHSAIKNLEYLNLNLMLGVSFLQEFY